jgi:hypothetical protein
VGHFVLFIEPVVFDNVLSEVFFNLGG